MRSPLARAIGCVLLLGLAAPCRAQDVSGEEADRSFKPGPARPPADVALERVEALAALGNGDPAEATRAATQEDAIALARLALERAGADAIAPLASRLDAVMASSDGDAAAVGQALAWALGESASRLPLDEAGRKLRARAVAALRRALWMSHWPARLSAASALGLLEVREAELELVTVAVWSSAEEGDSAGRAPGAEGAILLALAGTGGSVARAMVNDALRAGGDIRWARGMMALHVRLGPSCWPDLVDALEEANGEDVRTTAAAALLLLAEPASACRIAEAYGQEPNQSIRLTLLQVLAATASPIAREALRSIALHEHDERLARAAGILAAAAVEPRLQLDPRVDSARVREALESLSRGQGFPRDLRDVEGGATLLDLPLIERTLRRLPLREDGAWVDDHARLAQVRARMLCATWPDGVPQGTPRVGRPRPATTGADLPPTGPDLRPTGPAAPR